MTARSYIVVPARLESTRLPRKLLLARTGRPVLQHTYESAAAAGRPQGIVVAADSPEIAAAVASFGGHVIMTNPQATCGTERVAEVAQQMPDVDVFVNVQGDEPEIDPAAIDHVVALLEQHAHAPMATLATPIRDRQSLLDPACVKVVCNAAREALYFSRCPIPFVREWSDALLEADPPRFLQHIGLYAYRRSFLLEWSRLPPAPLESLERLEQLRVLTSGATILVGIIPEAPLGIDTAADYEAFVRRVGSC